MEFGIGFGDGMCCEVGYCQGGLVQFLFHPTCVHHTLVGPGLYLKSGASDLTPKFMCVLNLPPSIQL